MVLLTGMEMLLVGLSGEWLRLFTLLTLKTIKNGGLAMALFFARLGSIVKLNPG